MTAIARSHRESQVEMSFSILITFVCDACCKQPSHVGDERGEFLRQGSNKPTPSIADIVGSGGKGNGQLIRKERSVLVRRDLELAGQCRSVSHAGTLDQIRRPFVGACLCTTDGRFGPTCSRGRVQRSVLPGRACAAFVYGVCGLVPEGVEGVPHRADDGIPHVGGGSVAYDAPGAIHLHFDSEVLLVICLTSVFVCPVAFIRDNTLSNHKQSLLASSHHPAVIEHRQTLTNCHRQHTELSKSL